MLPVVARAGLLSRLNDVQGAFSAVGGMFDGWIPTVQVAQSVRVQGSPYTSPRTTLHFALATMFGLSPARVGDKFSVTANVDHRNNIVEVVFAINTTALSALLSSIGSELPAVVKEELQKLKDAAARALAGDTDNLEEYIEGIDPAKDPKDLPGKVVIPPAIALENPPLIKKPNATPKRGLGGKGIRENPVVAPWLIARVAPGAGGKEIFEDIKQVKKLGIKSGPELLFNIAKDRTFSGVPPWQLIGGDNIQPFADIVKFHAPNLNNRNRVQPIMTREDDINPQYQEALGVDIKTLVAQILHDPAVLPPRPKTDQGPATTVGD